jgi:hypothetical protein|tara:strand:- start:4423 stop:4557 length:135 start_codon:yes stop_codon:yes gene_type:complete
MEKVRLLIDLPVKVSDAIKAKAKKVSRKRKQYIELLCIEDAKKK